MITFEEFVNICHPTYKPLEVYQNIQKKNLLPVLKDPLLVSARIDRDLNLECKFKDYSTGLNKRVLYLLH